MLQSCVSCQKKANGMIGIYQHQNELDIMFHSVTGIEVEIDDHLCVPCYEELKAAYRFKERSLQNNTHRLTAESASTLSAACGAGTNLEICIVKEPLSSLGQTNGHPEVEDVRQLKEEALLNTIEVEEFVIHYAQQEEVDKDAAVNDKECANESTKEQPASQDELTSDGMEEEVIPPTRATRQANASNGKVPSLRALNLVKKNPNLPKVHSLMCEYCFKVFTKLAEKIEHSGMHQSEVKPYRCFHDGCGSSFKDRGGLRSHVRIHAPVKRYACSRCPKRFHTNNSREVHERIHDGEKPFVCPKCHKGFTESGNLKKHIRSHTDERPYLCTVCDKSFRTHYSHMVHMRWHSNERPFVCDECGKRFITTGKLTIHRRAHTRERPYKCDTCECRYADSSSLRRHQRNVHGGNT